MRNLRIVALAPFLILLTALAALAQGTILQGGPWTPGHAPGYVGQGSSQPIVQDTGPAGGGGLGLGLSELNITSRGNGNGPFPNSGTGPYNTHECVQDTYTQSPAGYHYLCLDANAQGGGLITYGASGGAPQLPFNFIINGASYPFPPPPPSATASIPIYTTTPEFWGAKGDCATDDYPAIAQAIAYLASTYGGGTVLFGNKCYAVGQTIVIGNGSVTSLVATASTINNIHLVGVGSPYGAEGGTFLRTSTRLLYTGNAGASTALVKFMGPIQSSDYSYMVLDCNSRCGYAAEWLSLQRGKFVGISHTGYTSRGLYSTTQPATSVFNGQDAELGTARNYVNDLLDVQSQAGTSALVLDGYTSYTADTTFNTFCNLVFNLTPLGAGTAIEEDYSDDNYFCGAILINTFNAANTPIVRNYAEITAGQAVYPAANTYNALVEINGTVSWQANVNNGTTPQFGSFVGYQGESRPNQLPRHPYTTSAWGWYGDEGTAPWFGSMWGLWGENVYELGAFRNKLLNTQFTEFSLGNPVTGTIDNGTAFTADNWFLSADNTSLPFAVTQETPTPGQTAVPYNPLHFAEIAVTGPSNDGTFLTFSQLIPNVQTFQAMNATLSFWAFTGSGSATLPLSTLTQVFGGTGSPNVNVFVAGDGFHSSDLTVTTTPKKFWFTFVVPTIAGKTVSGGGDGLECNIFLPINVSFNISIADPQCEEGPIDTAYDRRNVIVDALLNGPPTGSGVVVRNDAPSLAGPISITGVGLNSGINETQTNVVGNPPASPPTVYGYNNFTITEGTTCPNAVGVCAGWLYTLNTGGASSNGSKTGIFVNSNVLADGGSMTALFRDYSPIQLQNTSGAVMPAGLNGPAIWGGANCVANLTSSARGWANMGCVEGDLNNASPDLVDLVGTTMALTGHVHPTGTVAAFSVGSCTGCDQFDIAYLVSNRNGNNGVSTTGAVIGAINAATMGNFANFPLSTFTNILNFANFVLTGAGNITKSTAITITTGGGSQLELVNSTSGNAALVINDAIGSLASSIVFDESGVQKWQIGKQTDNSFFMFDQANTATFFAVSTGGNVTLGETGKTTAVATALGVTGAVTAPGFVGTSAAPTVTSGQIGYGGTVAASSNCGSLMSAVGCVVVNIAGTAHYVPYYHHPESDNDNEFLREAI